MNSGGFRVGYRILPYLYVNLPLEPGWPASEKLWVCQKSMITIVLYDKRSIGFPPPEIDGGRVSLLPYHTLITRIREPCVM